MQNLNQFKEKNRDIVTKVERGSDGGSVIYYGMVLVACLVTGTLTYSLIHKGMSGSPLYKDWLAFAAFLPTLLLEGSAIGLMYGRQHWFRSKEQRNLAYRSAWVIWGILILNAVTEFIMGFDGYEAIPGMLKIYTRYVLPLCIVGVGVLWKELYDKKPESQQRAEVLEANAEFQAGLLDVQRQQNNIIINQFREALNSPEVIAAQNDLFKKAAIDHARGIAGFVDTRKDDKKLLDEGRSNYQRGEVLDYTDRPKA